MKKTIAIVLVLLAFLPCRSQKTMREIFLSMPDSISTGLNENLRKELVDYAGMGVEAKVKNLFLGTATLDTIHNEYVSVKLNEAAAMQMRLFRNAASTDSVVCVVRTFMAPEPESEVHFYSLDWNPVERSFGLDKLDNPSVGQFVHRPDTMSVERFEELCSMIEPVMLSAELSPAEETITFNLSTPLVNSEERKALSEILLPQRYCWDGQILKKCY